MRLKGKTALIAGGASGVEGRLMGIGGAAVRRFSREGAQVVIADIKDEVGERTAAEIRAEGGEALYVHLDVTGEAEWMVAVAAAVDRFGKLDALVDAAGTSIRHRVEETPVETFDLEMAVHARGAFLGAKHAIPRMREAGGGSIVIVSSMYGIVGAASTSYPTAKGAMRNFTKAAAIQYAAEGIRVNSGAPRLRDDAAYGENLQRAGDHRSTLGAGAHAPARHRGRDRQRHSVPGVRRVVVHHGGGAGDRRGVSGGVRG